MSYLYPFLASRDKVYRLSRSIIVKVMVAFTLRASARQQLSAICCLLSNDGARSQQTTNCHIFDYRKFESCLVTRLIKEQKKPLKHYTTITICNYFVQGFTYIALVQGERILIRTCLEYVAIYYFTVSYIRWWVLYVSRCIVVCYR